MTKAKTVADVCIDRLMKLKINDNGDRKNLLFCDLQN